MISMLNGWVYTSNRRKYRFKVALQGLDGGATGVSPVRVDGRDARRSTNNNCGS
jgi:hypothetical protein